MKGIFKKMLQAAVVVSPVGGYVYGVKSMEATHHAHEELVEETKKGKVGVYTFPTSPFAHKVTSYMDYHGIPYTEVTVNMLLKPELYFSKDYKLVPVAFVKGSQVNDSSDIIRILAKDKNSMFSAGFSSNDEKVMAVVDEKVAPAALMSILNDNDSASKVGGKYGTIYKIALPMFRPIAKMLFPRKMGEAADAELLVPALKEAFKMIGKNRNPSASELALFGVLRNMDNLDCTIAALEDCGRTQWYNDLLNKCEKNSKREVPTSCCSL
eukprot:TRINITY_DN10214_c0_g5_i1.p1 TRINITY_DN10214_c0_g5~~TRINITY_DN10214_c0_g5_i1.p1  ORF type:complete len:268 (+),score=81.82 TRINITY_DN10214_c0_g5_i1:60-863(+)